jgi:predicted RNA methylase
MTVAYKNTEAAAASGEAINFSFGRNWEKYLRGLTPERLQQARDSLSSSLGLDDLGGRSFLDAGCGSGVFSQAALDLGASRVTSVDVDPNSINCARFLRSRHVQSVRWRVVEGSLLQPEFVRSLEPVDIVYSWGVLHHTGAMWRAVENVLQAVAPGGLCVLALYRPPTRVETHMRLKRTYNRLPGLLRPVLAAAYCAALVARLSAARRESPWRYVAAYGRDSRGMSLWRDVEDWLGGLPCEFAEADEVRRFVEPQGFSLEHVLVQPPGANNEYRFRRTV